MVLPLLIGSVFFFSGKLRNAFRETRLSTSRMNSFLQEGITGMRVIQAFGAEERSQEQHIGHARKLRDAHLGTVVWFGLFWPTVDLVMAISIVLLAWWATGMAASGTVEVGVLVFFILSIDRFFWPIRDLAEKYNLFQSAMASAERIFRIFDTIELIEEKPELQLSTQDAAVAKPICFEEGIKFEDIWFAYKGEDWVIKGVNLEIKKGEHVAIVGSTGSGKTTITNLLPRFYDIQKGRITIDGKDSRDFSVPSLRALFAHVQQDVFLFAGDIASNIKLSKEMTDDEVWQVAKHVNADKFIRNFDDGLAHEVRERGGTFSAGERQLISFARALAFDPQILILDEATSNIDTETELLIQDALTKLMENRTAIVIAHRLSTIQHADKIVVLHHGKIAEQGKHQDLLAQDGIYRKLYELQMHEEERSHAPSSPGGDLVPNPA
jgi:ABC-type multidrug transport system fused ATPase/permease subunit